MIIKHSGSRKWINEQKTNSVLFHNNNLSAIWYSPSSHRSRAGLQNAEWLGLLLCPARPQICTHSVPRKWPGSYYTMVLSILSKPCPELFDTQTDSCPFIAVPNKKCSAAKVGEMFPETVWWAALFFRQDIANPHPLGRFASNWGTIASNWRTAMWSCLT